MAPKGTPVVVKMDNPSYSVVEIDDPDAAFKPMEKTRGKNPKQVTWVLLLKAHRAVGRVAWIATLFWDLLGTIKRSLHIPSDDDIHGLLHLVYVTWLPFRADYIAPLIQALSKFCVALFLVQSADRLMLSLGCFRIKYKKIKPKIEGDPFESVDVEECSYEYPMILVQIPMCNEREVYEQSISAVCQLDWPKDRLLIQVLDDSNDESIRYLIKAEVATWSQRGINIIYRHRLERTGYKAGNLKSAMSCEYVKAYEFVAIFDADFQPSPKFLKQTVPHFKDNPELGLVQARWAFVNKDENLLTRLQNINLCFHFEVEQQVNGVFLNFFGFNGTAGVWRIKALEESGGWLERTTVEDMDIAIHAHLNGWKFIFLNDVKVLREVPESYEAYRKQQHQWHSGPMQLFRLCLPAILTSKIAIWKKANLIQLFFLLRKLILPFYSFTLFCIILPLTMFVPEAELPVWLGSSYEWVVTKKAGRSSESDLVAAPERESKITNQQHIPRGASQSEFTEYNELKEQKQAAPIRIKKVNKIYRKKLTLAFLLLAASVRSLLSAQGVHFYFLLFQGVTFLLVGLDLIGEQMS
ncbi:hypothetical protein CXB51_014339 [Gossypium anomalum]|uniref:Glycosyltransferase 2-like domain-containing protein n=1 Tax=Gossypium anomalum TaxID=47600 RepID=A0A8J6D0B9_9ROSI|nr:hypothetical protein CXB51_014339 [Gossypium anomalum]